MALLDSSYRVIEAPFLVDKINFYTRKYKYLYDVEKNFSDAYLYVDSAIQLLQANRRNSKLVEIYIDVLNDKAYLLRKQNNYEAALKYYLVANKIYRKEITDTCLAFGTPSALGDLFLSINNYKAAITYYLDDYRHQQACDDHRFLRFFFIEKILLSVGTCYTKMQMYDSAYYFFNNALQFVRTRQKLYDLSPQPNFPLVAEAVINGFLANITAIRGDVSKAEQLFEQSMSVTRTADLEYYANELVDLGEMYVREKRTSQALQTIQRLDSLSGKYAMPEARMNYFRLMALLEESKKNDAAYLQFTSQYEALADSLNNPAKKFRYVDVQREFAIHQQMGVNENLEEKSKVKNNFILSGILALALLSVMAFLFVKGIKKKRKQTNSLEKLNKLLAGKNDELEAAGLNLQQIMKNNMRIMNIMAHDLRSPLSGMQLLLRSMEKRKLEPVSKHIVVGMGLVCQYTLGMLKVLLKKGDKEDLLSQQNIHIEKIIADVIQELMPKIVEKELLIDTRSAKLEMFDNLQKLKLLVNCYLSHAIENAAYQDSIEIVAQLYHDRHMLLIRNKRVLGFNTSIKVGEKMSFGDLLFLANETLATGKEQQLAEDRFGYGFITPVKLAGATLHVYMVE